MAMQPSMQQSSVGTVQKSSTESPFGLVCLTDGAEKVLLDSRLFIPGDQWTYSGIIFHEGEINGTKVVYARSGELGVNAATTVQILVDKFHVRGIVLFGGAGSINDSVLIGNVSVPSHIANIGNWSWKKNNSDQGILYFKSFNDPMTGGNLLGSIVYYPSTWFVDHQQPKEEFFLPVDPNWLEIASRLKDLKLEKCVKPSVCLDRQPKVTFGLKAGSSDLFLTNKAYGDFIFQTYGISTVDTASGAVAMTCLSNKLPFIVFRGVSNIIADADPKSTFYPLGNINAFKTAAAFLGLLSDMAKE